MGEAACYSRAEEPDVDILGKGPAFVAGRVIDRHRAAIRPHGWRDRCSAGNLSVRRYLFGPLAWA